MLNARSSSRRTAALVAVAALAASVATTIGPRAGAATCRASVAFVAGSSPAPTADQSLLAATAAAAGGTSCVTTLLDQTATADAVSPYDAVVISSTVRVDQVPAALALSVRPMVVSEPLLFEEFALSSADGTDTSGAGTSLSVRASRLTGRTTATTTEVLASAGPLNWVADPAEGVIGASLVGNDQRVALFGTELLGQGNRVGFFAGAGAVLSDAGAGLLRSALDWVLSPRPLNDDFIDAPEIADRLGTLIGGNLAHATIEPKEQRGGPVGTVWWRFTSPIGGTLGVRALPGTVVRLGISDSVGQFRAVAVSDGMPTYMTVWPGMVVRLQVSGATASDGAFTADTFLPPLNNAFVEATTISGVSGATNGNTVGAGVEKGEPLPKGPARKTLARETVWFRWESTSPNTEAITVRIAPLQDSPWALERPLVTVYEGGAIGALTYVAGPANELTFLAKPGTFYSMCVDGTKGAKATVTGGTFEMSWEYIPY